MEKEIVLKIKLDKEKGEFVNVISSNGFENNNDLENSFILIGLLETIKQQEIKKLINK